LPVRHDGRHRGHDPVISAVHRCRDRQADLLDRSAADHVTVPADVGEPATQLLAVGNGVAGVPPQRTGDDVLLQFRIGVGQQDLAHAGQVQRQPPTDPGDHMHRAASGDPLHEDGIASIQYGELRVLASRLVHILEERHRDLAQPESAGCQGCDLP